MGCLFGCFRNKDTSSNVIVPPEPVVPRSKNALSSLFLHDDESLQKGEGEGGRNPLPRELDVKEPKDEAKFLKACGTLSETPVEIRKVSDKWKRMPAQNGGEKSSKVNSWFPNASIEKLKLEKQSDESPIPVKFIEGWVTGSGSLLDSPSSCVTEGHNAGWASGSSIQRSDTQNAVTPIDIRDIETHAETSSVTPQVFAPSVQSKNKSVCFDCESDRSAFSSKGSSSECASQHAEQSGSVGTKSVRKPTPDPALEKLPYEQTPGTMFPASTNDVAIGMVDAHSQWTELKDENFDSNHLRQSFKLNDEATLMSTPTSELVIEHLSVGQETENEASLSSLLKPASANQDGNNMQFGSVSGKNVYRARTNWDRPILGMVAAHWNDDETSRISPKWWDGNGIPNSTNKYKEDQKVSWHSTPFEERLEKALSEETFTSQRKPISGTPPVEFNENEESDTALSRLQSSAHLKSVVSF